MLALLAMITDIKQRHKLEQLYHAYHKDMFRVAYGVLRDHHEAEDVVQTTIIKLSGLLEKIVEVECNKTRALIVIIARNTAIDIYNKRKRGSSIPIEDMADYLKDGEALSVDSQVIRLDESKWVAEQLSKLHPRYADVLALKYFYDYNTMELSKLMNISENNVCVLLYRAKKAFHQIINEGRHSDDYQRTC